MASTSQRVGSRRSRPKDMEIDDTEFEKVRIVEQSVEAKETIKTQEIHIKELEAKVIISNKFILIAE
jgi:hypothetical protein